MDIANNAWSEVVATNGNKFIVQNVGDTRIGFLLQAAPPNDNDPVDNGTHGLLLPGSAPFTVTDLTTDGLTMYVRSIGPKDGQIYIT